MSSSWARSGADFAQRFVGFGSPTDCSRLFGSRFSLALEHREHIGCVDHDAATVFHFDEHLAGKDFLGQHAGPPVVR